MAHPCPVAYRYLPLSGDASDIVQLIGSGDSDNRRPLSVAWFVIFQLQVMVADILYSGRSTSPKLHHCLRSLTTHAKQVYRIYHIYDKNPFVCVLPSIITVTLFCESVSPLPPWHSPLPSLSLSRDFVGVSCVMV